MEKSLVTYRQTKRAECQLLRNGSALSTSFFEGKLPEVSCYNCAVHLVVMILIYTGARCSEAMKVRESDLLDETMIFIRSMKGTKNRFINIPVRLVEYLRFYFLNCSIFLDTSYNKVYNFVSKLKAVKGIIRNDQNFSVTHYFRKCLIKKMFFEYRNTSDFICDFFGWREAKSIAYYI